MSFFSDFGSGAAALGAKLGDFTSGLADFAQNTLIPLAGVAQQVQGIIAQPPKPQRPPPSTVGNALVPGQLPTASQVQPAPPAVAAPNSNVNPMVVAGVAVVALLLLSRKS